MLLNLKVVDNTHLLETHAKILAAAKIGVKAATNDALQFIQEDVVEQGRYVGHRYYPHVKPETARRKALAGKEQVGKWTGNWITSFDTSYMDGGLVGIVSGGGHVKGNDYERFQEKWDVEKLWAEERGRYARNIIKTHVIGALK